jgi:preprotein translocase subunit SecG
MLYTIILVLIVIVSLLLMLVVLLQSGQGQGLTGIAASSMMGGSGLGARRTADLLSKATSIFGATFLVLCVLANFAIDRQNAPSRSILQDQAVPGVNQFDAPSQTAPAVPQQQSGSTESNDNASGNDDNGDN